MCEKSGLSVNILAFTISLQFTVRQRDDQGVFLSLIHQRHNIVPPCTQSPLQMATKNNTL